MKGLCQPARKRIVAGNWKMNGSQTFAIAHLEALKNLLSGLDKSLDVVIIPPALYLPVVSRFVQDAGWSLGAQNVAQWSSGAYTGEISAEMLKDIGCRYVIIGHSERRRLLNEDDQVVACKIEQALDAGLSPILCVGETAEERDAGKTLDVITRQLQAGLHRVQSEQLCELVIAYEPVWAIGTGRSASAEQAQSVHKAIRAHLQALSLPGLPLQSGLPLQGSSDVACLVPILYGGSVKAASAGALFSQPDIDGGLIGGASLDAVEFSGICTSWH